MQPLQVLLKILCRNSNIHICLHDLSGILRNEPIEYQFHFHSRPFCDIAKSTPDGMSACYACKAASIEHAIFKKESYSGYCAYGLYEVVTPVIIKDEVKCIVYVGNLMKDKKEALERLNKTCLRVGVDADKMTKKFKYTETTQDPELYFQIADIIREYIIALSNKPVTENNNNYHWAVESILQYVDLYYDKDISLKSISKIYYVNEKYIGRFFKAQVGISFRQYLRQKRMEKAKELLLSTKMSITKIAYDTGFSDSAFFSHIFWKENGITPGEFRKLTNN